jgi:fibronectin type 3 domain-containing protein
VAVHAALLPSGKVLVWQGDFASGGQQYVFDPATGVSTQVPSALVDLFCAGQAVVADGRVLVIGGTATDGGVGINAVTAFVPGSQTWQSLKPMNHARWYATGTTLGDGRVLVSSGYDHAGALVTVPEIYDVTKNSWTDLPAATNAAQPIYPFVFQLPDGRILWAGASETATPTQVLSSVTGSYASVDSRVVDGGSISNYAPGKFVKAGSAGDDGGSGPSLATAFTLDMNTPNPTWQPTGSMQYPRTFVNLTALPDGNVLATEGETDRSGYNNANGVLPAEEWNPTSGSWTTLASMAVPRLYHNTALLLPDGRVFVSGGGGENGVPDQTSAQIYSPPYLFKGARPTITSAPATGKYNASMFVGTPDAANIARVSLIRTGSGTHFFDQNTRTIPLNFSATTGGLNVQMPVNGNTAPPGYYMLFIVNGQGVPSVAKFVRFPAPYEDTSPPTAPKNLVAHANSATNVGLTWSASTDNVGVTGYNVLRNGTKIATSTGASYTDKTAAGNHSYTYTVTAYDKNGNTSPSSNQATATTPVDTQPPVITNVVATSSSTGATITWTTNEIATSQIRYGLSATYNLSTTKNNSLVLAHSQTISGLTPNTTYHFSVQSVDGAAHTTAAPDAMFKTTPLTPIVDKQVITHTTTGVNSIVSPALSTTHAKDLLVAFVSADGPGTASSQTVASVTGGGLTWTRRARANGQPGTAEIWQAVAPNPLTNATVTATLSAGGYVGSMVVTAFTHADTAVNGATRTAFAASGAPSSSLTTTKAGSWVWAAGTDWSTATAHTVGTGQTRVDQYLAPVGDTYWVQRQTNPTATAGTSVTINDTAPTADQWDLALIEIRAG